MEAFLRYHAKNWNCCPKSFKSCLTLDFNFSKVESAWVVILEYSNGTWRDGCADINIHCFHWEDIARGENVTYLFEFLQNSCEFVWKRSIGWNKSECWKSEYSISHFPQNYLFPFESRENEIRLLTNSRQKQKLKCLGNCKILLWVLHSTLLIIWKLQEFWQS